MAGRPYSVESVPRGREGRARRREGRLRTPGPCGLLVKGWGGGNLRPTSVFGPWGRVESWGRPSLPPAASTGPVSPERPSPIHSHRTLEVDTHHPLPEGAEGEGSASAFCLGLGRAQESEAWGRHPQATRVRTYQHVCAGTLAHVGRVCTETPTFTDQGPLEALI